MNVAVLDFETTGLGNEDEIIQVGLVLIDGDQMVDRFTTLVKPSKAIPDFITQMTGIDDEMVADAPPIDEVIVDMLPRLADRILVGHRIDFDLRFLQNALEQSGYSPFDGMVLDTYGLLRICYPGLSSLELSMVSGALNIPHERPHQADSDAEATAHIWLKCIDILDSLPLLTVQRLDDIFSARVGTADEDLAFFIHELKNVKERVGDEAADSAHYYRQFKLNVDDWDLAQPVERDEESFLAESFEEYFEQLKINLAEQFDDFEQRPAQEQMIREVYSALEQEQHLMIEAGTGTGKSLAYLIPALFYGMKEQQTIIVSTHTINLQEQIRNRDIPLLEQILPVPFRAAVLKGRSHYLCLRKFEQKINGRQFEGKADDVYTAAQMVVWLGQTERGDDEELNLTQGSKQFWHTVASDSDSCLNRACPWFKKCFYHRARHEANIADVVITNHSMLFTDVKAEHRLLPTYDQLIIDEAHHFDDVASKHLGLETQYYAFLNALTYLYRDSSSGFLPTLQHMLRNDINEESAEWISKIETLYPKIVTVKEAWDTLTDLLYQLMSGQGNGSQEVAFVRRFDPETLPEQWDTLQTIENNITIELNDILKVIEQLLADIKEENDDFDVQSVVTDLNGVVKSLHMHRDALRFFMKMDDQSYVYWMEATPTHGSKSMQLYAVPIDVSPLLKEHFFDAKQSVVLTSATLSVERSFQYSSDQLGLAEAAKEGKLVTFQLPPAFDYRSQVLVSIPRDFPKIRGVGGDEAFIDRLIDSLLEVAIVTKGRMLVLFTSYRMLRQVHEPLQKRLKAEGIQVLGQGIESSNRSKLIDLFQGAKASVLLGTSSFWEGIDIPGEALSCLAIVRLPFQPPNHPLVEAKSEHLKKQKQNPFMKLSVPQAVIRFKQGFGRLVRKATDRGVVIIYDTRVIDTRYGKNFLYSLPGPKIEHMPTEQMSARINEWFQLEEG